MCPLSKRIGARFVRGRTSRGQKATKAAELLGGSKGKTGSKTGSKSGKSGSGRPLRPCGPCARQSRIQCVAVKS